MIFERLVLLLWLLSDGHPARSLFVFMVQLSTRQSLVWMRVRGDFDVLETDATNFHIAVVVVVVVS